MHSPEAVVAGMKGDKIRQLAHKDFKTPEKVSPSKKLKDGHIVKIRSGITTISGGQNNIGFPASTVSVVEDNITHLYIHLEKTQPGF